LNGNPSDFDESKTDRAVHKVTSIAVELDRGDTSIVERPGDPTDRCHPVPEIIYFSITDSESPGAYHMSVLPVSSITVTAEYDFQGESHVSLVRLT
jgi:hypothetical protein